MYESLANGVHIFQERIALTGPRLYTRNENKTGNLTIDTVFLHKISIHNFNSSVESHNLNQNLIPDDFFLRIFCIHLSLFYSYKMNVW